MSDVDSKMSDKRMKVESAGMIIIGDEILNGFTAESNLQITSNALATVGVPLRRVVVVSDDEEEISAEVLTYLRCPVAFFPRVCNRCDVCLKSLI